MSIAQGLVRLLGGEINVNSELSKGSEFSFTLPITGDYRKEADKSIQKNPSDPLQIILLGAHHNIDEKVIESINKGAVLSYSNNVPDLYKILKSSERLPDLILFYPEANQKEPCALINEINNIMPQIPILVITNITRSLFIEECLVAGAKDYIAEPIDTELLNEKIELLTHRNTKIPD